MSIDEVAVYLCLSQPSTGRCARDGSLRGWSRAPGGSAATKSPPSPTRSC